MNDIPISLGEHRAVTEDDCTKWTPREMLLSLVREIDGGVIAPDGMLVCFFTKEGAYTRTGMRRSKSTIMEAVAMVEIAKHDLLVECG